MKRFTPILFACVMIIMLLFSWSVILNYDKNQSEIYENQLQKAQRLEKKGIYIDAVKEYETLLSMKPQDFETAIKIADLYEELEQPDNFKKALKKAIDLDSSSIETYIRLADAYTASGDDSELYNVLMDAKKADPDNQEIKNRLIELMKQFSIRTIDDTDIGDLYLHESNGYCARVKRDGKFGLISPGGSLVVNPDYDELGLRRESLLPVKENGQYFYVDNNMYKKLVPDVEVEYLGSFGEGKAPAAYNGKYGYINKSLYQLKNGSETLPTDKDGNIVYSFEYDYAGAFANNTAAVKKGDKWALINGNLEPITGFDFDDVLLDDYGYCSSYNRIITKKNSDMFIYDCDGKQIGGPYEDAKLFKSDQPTAVKLNGKWGFADQNGEITIEPTYDDAESFCIDFAPVKTDGKWGAIGLENQMIIEPNFNDFNSFSADGHARVIDEKNRLCFITVHVYSGDDK